MRRREALGVLGAAALGVPAVVRRARGQSAPYEPVGSVAVSGAKEAVLGEDGTTAYVATGDGFAVVDIADPADPEPIADRRGLLADRDEGPLRDIWDVKVDRNRLLVVGPAHGGGLQAALLYDVADPSAPRRVAVHETDFPIHNAALRDGHAFLTGNDGHGNPLVAVDMTAAPPTELGRWSPLDHDRRWAEVPSAVRPLHDLVVRDGRAYLNYWDIGTWVADVTDPTAPSLLGRIGGRRFADLTGTTAALGAQVSALPGNHHSCALGDDGALLAIGKEAWATAVDEPAGGPGGIDLWDVSSLRSPTLLATIDPPPTPDPTRGGTWTTAHNFDVHGTRLYSAWYQGGVKLHDIARPDAPRELAWWRSPAETAFWTAQRAATGVVASDMGPGGLGSAEDAGLYVFPDRPGEQPDPPSLTATATPSPTRTVTSAVATTDAGTSPSPTEVGTPGQPGFGPAIGLLGLGTGIGLGARARDRGDE